MVWGADEELSAKFDSDEESVLGRADGELSKEFDLEEEYVLGRGDLHKLRHQNHWVRF